jgi:hypothetical protein
LSTVGNDSEVIRVDTGSSSPPPQALRPTPPSSAAVAVPPLVRMKPRRFMRALTISRNSGPPWGLLTWLSCCSMSSRTCASSSWVFAFMLAPWVDCSSTDGGVGAAHAHGWDGP